MTRLMRQILEACQVVPTTMTAVRDQLIRDGRLERGPAVDAKALRELHRL